MKNNYESVYRMKLTGYQVRTAIGILNERRLALKSQGCTLENSEEYVGVFNLLSRFLDLPQYINSFGRCFIFVCVSCNKLLGSVYDRQFGPFD